MQQGQPHPHQHTNFEHLVEHAVAQQSQAAYAEKEHPQQGMEGGQEGGGGGILVRPQVHKPPQATKSSRFRGVYKRQRGGRWEASIVLESKNCRWGISSVGPCHTPQFGAL